MTGVVWHGRAGSVALGPTEGRVARYLDDRTRHGWVTLRTLELATTLGLERSEAYRILARLRELGLFGISNDRGGHRGGRRVWRTANRHDGTGLDPARHRSAFARVRGAARRARSGSLARLAIIRAAAPGVARPPVGSGAVVPPAAPGPTFAERMRRAGLGGLMAEWGVT